MNTRLRSYFSTWDKNLFQIIFIIYNNPLRVIIFNLVQFLSKNSNQTGIFFFKKKTKTDSNQPGSVQFGFLGQK